MNYRPDNFGGFGGGFNKEDFAEKFKNQNKNLTRGKKILIGVIIAVFALVLIAALSLNFIVEVWQVKEIGANFDGVFWKNFFCKLAVSASGFIVVFIISLINLFLIKKIAINERFEAKILKKKWLYIAVSALIALMFGGVMGESSYLEFLKAVNSTSFGTVDPLFGKDIGYYVFIRPFFATIVSALKGAFLSQTVIVALLYYFIFSLSGTKRIKDMITQEKGALIQVVFNVLIYYLVMVCSYQLTKEGLLYGSFGRDNLAGAGFIEAKIWLNYYNIAPVILLLSVILTAVFLWKKKIKASIISILTVPVIYVLVLVVSVLTQQFVVAPDERNYQDDYISYNMDATQKAFGIDNMREVQFDFSNDLTSETIAQNSSELTNTRIIDFGASLTAYNQLQYLRKYYTFNDIDVVPYEVDGNLTGVFMSARELDKDRLEETARSYTNEKFRYTHGYGVVASPFNRVTQDGQPYFAMHDIPTVSQNGMPKLTQPRIYYGESTNDYVIVGSDNKELDYSEGYNDIENTYDGDTGVKLSFMKRLIYSLYYKDYKMFFSGNIDSDSKILINRNVLDRVKIVAPFLTYEEDPQIVVSDSGEIKWIIDAYTTSTQYPYSQQFSGVNYIRNSIKAVVDAYTGDVTFYIIDENDPITQTYKKIYPGLFSDEKLPDDIINHITTPEGLFKVQTEVYQRYHLNDAGQFYDQADVWRVASEKYQNDEVKVSPYFNIFTIEGEEKPELVLNMPYVLGDKHNMVAILMKRTDIEHYGEMVLYRIPKSDTVYGPMQIENKIDNAPDISREMTLWGQGGSSVIRGNLLVIPFKNSIFYVEPVYITSENDASLPEVKRIIVAYKDEIVMEPTLEEALAKVLKNSSGVNAELSQPTEENVTESTPTTEDIDDISAEIQKVIDAYDAFSASSKNNDWEKMGADLKKLDDAISNIR